jgi:integrase
VERPANGERKPQRNRSLWDEFHDIQKAAGISLKCYGDHEHTDACHYYGFHDVRRAARTYNATRMTAVALQKMMRHKSFSTTLQYINAAPQLNEAAEKVWVPALPAAVAS